jgi:acetyl-CoA carboxylase carboxyltransferase component
VPGLRARVGGSIAVTTELIGSRPAVVARCRPEVRAGAISERAGFQLAAAAVEARAGSIPLVMVISSSGADVTEGMASLNAWGTAAREVAACSGRVPVVCALTGPAVSGPALLLGIADLVCACEGSVAYVSGPGMVAEVTGVQIDAAALGGLGVHWRHSGVAAFIATEETDALEVLGDALSYLPPSADDLPVRHRVDDDANRTTPELRSLLPSESSGGYDVREVIRVVVDEGRLLEAWAGSAPNLVVGFASVAGVPVGVVANQPSTMAGTLDIAASQKGARFVGLCDSFNLPLLTFVDTPGFFPGKDLEWRGMIRHGGQMAFAYARASVPRICVILRKAYGGAYIVMDCRTMGNDLCIAWPTAEVAVMGAKGAVEILHRRAPADERADREAEYGRDLLTPWVAAERGLVDEVIDPISTRIRVAAAVELLQAKRELLSPRAHDNSPC